MASMLRDRLQHLSRHADDSELWQIGHGIEKEGVRVTPAAAVSQTGHPLALGSPLTHPYITTDYSEALLEFITPVYSDISEALDFLNTLHAETVQQLPAGEAIWNSSMPPVLAGDEYIPIARYGSSNTGKMRHQYRQGLACRYGKAMQMIAGIHYNFSVSQKFWQELLTVDRSEENITDYISAGYLALIRNFRRHAWLLFYLFGATPALDDSFFYGERRHSLQKKQSHTLYHPWATSLRMSDYGYHNSVQAELDVSYNTLDRYIDCLHNAIAKPYGPYKKFRSGVEGEHCQLSSNVLQIENEYYSSVRPKRVTREGETALQALHRRGVEYVEIRCLDINPFLPLGIDRQQACFVDTFLLYCALENSPMESTAQRAEIERNLTTVAIEGRKPGLVLEHERKERTLGDWGREILDKMAPIAQLLDSVNGCTDHTEALKAAARALQDASLTPSARIMARLHNHSFRDVFMQLSQTNTEHFRTLSVAQEQHQHLRNLAASSLAHQSQQEAMDTATFDSFLRDYFANSSVLDR